MGTRLELHDKLCDILGSDYVYFQPPSSIRMTYPAIVYSLDYIWTPRGSDEMYLRNNRYEIQYISRDPDNTIIDLMLEMPYCTFDRRFVVDNLYHDCFDLYF